MDSSCVDHQVEIKDACVELQRYRTKGDYVGGGAYYRHLPNATRSDKSVVIEAAQMHLAQGDYGRAGGVCDNGGPSIFGKDPSDEPLPDEISDETSVCLELIRANIEITRYCRLKRAVSIAARVGSVWLEHRVSEDGGAAFCAAYSYNKTLLHTLEKAAAQRLALRNCKESDVTFLSEHRVIIEFQYHRIMAIAAEQGLFDPVPVKRAAIASLELLQQFLQRNSRLREARLVLYFRTCLLNDLEDSSVETLLEDFIESLRGTTLEIEEGEIMLDLAEYKYKKGDTVSLEQGEILLREAAAKLTHAEHKFGHLMIEGIEQMRLSGSMTQIENYQSKENLAMRYFDLECYQNGMRALLFATTPLLSSKEVRGEILESIDELRIKAEASEAELLKQVIFLKVVTEALLQAPEYGSVLTSLEKYCADIPSEMAPQLQSIFARYLSQIYSKLGKLLKAVTFAEKGFDLLKPTYSYVEKSVAAFYLALCYEDIHRKLYVGSSEELVWLDKAVALLEEWAETDRQLSFTAEEHLKCLRLLEMENYRSRHFDAASTKALQWRKRVSEIEGSVSSSELSYGIEADLEMFIRENGYEKALSASISALEVCKNTPTASPLRHAQCWSRIANLRRMIFRRNFDNAASIPDHNWNKDLASLLEALKAELECLKLYRSTKGAEVIVLATNGLWYIIEDVALVSESDAEELSEGFIDELQITEDFCDELRRGVNTSEGLSSLVHGRSMVSRKEHLKLYSAGFRTCLRLKNPSEAWMWVQKGKARALSDALGHRAVIPRAIMNAVDEDPAASELYKQEIEARENALYAAPEAHIGASREIYRIREKMMQVPALKQILALREGAFDLRIEESTLDVSLGACDIPANRFKYVDWFIPRDENSAYNAIYLLVRKLNGDSHVRNLPLSVNEVQTWLRKTYTYPEGADPPLSKKTGNRLLAEMEGLVEGLEELTVAEDLLVFSPAEFLNQIPLHGLKVDGKPLIERNLVVYASSSAVLRHCLVRANTRLTDRLETQARSFLGVYDEFPPEGDLERAQIYSSLEDLAYKTHGSALTGRHVTKDKFREKCKTASWIHYHGHAIADEDDIFKSSIILSDGTEEPGVSKNDDSILDATLEDLTVAEIFDLHLDQNCPHISIIACDSGTQDVAAGDEPWGIVSAKLYAGASSVLGCLWPIESFAGREFSSAFYAAEQNVTTAKTIQSQEKAVINVALALKHAVCELRSQEATRQPYYWAPFVLHGSWFWPSQ